MAAIGAAGKVVVMRRSVREALERVDAAHGAVSAPAAFTLLNGCGESVESLLDDVLGGEGSIQGRTESLCVLLGLYGVGTIVHGVIGGSSARRAGGAS